MHLIQKTLVAILATVPVLAAQQAELLLDLNQTPVAQDSDVLGLFGHPGFARLGSVLIGTSQPPDSPLELRAFDTTARTTTKLAELTGNTTFPVRIQSSVIADLGGGRRLWFGAAQSLWVTDGTPNGTRRVLDLGAASPLGLRDLGNGRLLFLAGNPVELWSFDGTAASSLGTYQIDPFDPEEFVTDSSAGVGYFADSGRRFWRTDGTPAGTKIIMERPAIWLRGLAILNGKVLMSADGPNGYELWQSDGTTAGTAELRDIEPGSGSSSPDLDGIAFGGFYYFGATTTAANGEELWRTDGTAAGTSLVYDANPTQGSSPRDFQIAAGNLYFNAYTGTTWDLHRFAGSNTRPLGVNTYGRELTDAGNGLVAFTVPRNGNRVLQELWFTDGTPNGTRMIDIRPGVGESEVASITSLPGGGVVFSAEGPEGDREMWISDATAAGTREYIDVRSGYNTGDAVVGFLNAASEPDSESLFLNVSDGTSRKLARWANGQLTDLGDVRFHQPGLHEIFRNGRQLLLFSGLTNNEGSEPWVTDGTKSGTRLLKDILPGRLFSQPTQWTSLGDRAVFVAFQPATGAEVWVTDGTPAGTVMLPEIRPGANSSDPDDFQLYRGQVVFAATDSSGRRALWTTDGTPAGTKPWIANAPNHGSGPTGVVAHEGSVYYFADNHIWSTDGTAANTVQLTTSALPGTPTKPRWSGPLLYFFIEGSTSDLYSWNRSLRKIDSFQRGSITEAVVVGFNLYFVARKSGIGAEVWRANFGSASVAELRQGGLSSFPTDLLAIESGVYFVALSDRYGRELFYLANDSLVPQVVADLRPGFGHGAVAGAKFIGDDLLFVGATEAYGREIYRIRKARARDISFGGCPEHVTELTASAPVLGKTVRIAGTSPRGLAAEALLLGLPTTTPTLLPGSVCALRLSITDPVMMLAAPRFSRWQVGLSIPNDPVLEGRSVVVQTVSQRPGQFLASNAIRLVVGR